MSMKSLNAGLSLFNLPYAVVKSIHISLSKDVFYINSHYHAIKIRQSKSLKDLTLEKPLKHSIKI